MQEFDHHIGAGSSAPYHGDIVEPARTEADKAVWRELTMRSREVHKIEYGPIAEQNKRPIIVGATILSSPAQAWEVRDGLIEIEPYSREPLETAVDCKRVQHVLYSALDIEQMRHELGRIELSQPKVASI